MKVDGKARTMLVENLRRWSDSLHQDLFCRILEIEHSESVEEIMSRKQKLLDEYVRRMPLNSEWCYFCIQRIILKKDCNCEQCPYSWEHQVCQVEGSNFYVIIDAKRRLIRRVGKYYSGESYDDPGEEKEKGDI